MRQLAITLSLFAVILFSSCGSEETTVVETDSLEAKQSLLTEKQQELQALQDEIAQLKNEIVAMNPDLQERAQLVDTMHISANIFTRFVDIQGTVITDEIVNVVSEIPGRITYLDAKEGQYVKKGQLLAKLDTEATQKQIDEIKTSLSLAVDAYERQKRLWEQNIGSEMQYLQAKNNKERLEKSLETIEFQLTKANIYAPITGTVDMEMLKQGEVASPGMPIVTIMNTSKVKISTDLPERYLRIVKQGDIVDMYFPSIDLEMKGRVSLLGRSIDPSNRTLPVEISPLKYSNLLKPNLLAEIKVKELEIDNVVILPSEYILQQVDGQEYVYTVSQDDKSQYRASKTFITTGETADSKIVVNSGLQTADVVISKGARNISNGELIEFVESAQ